jgi:hypothetical protein
MGQDHPKTIQAIASLPFDPWARGVSCFSKAICITMHAIVAILAEGVCDLNRDSRLQAFSQRS